MIERETNLNDPWLVAVWPGPGNSAPAAAGYLLRELDFQPLGDFEDEEFHETPMVDVKDGVVGSVRPRGRFFALESDFGPDLVLFLAEAAPTIRPVAYCDALLDAVAPLGVRRVVSFSSVIGGGQPNAPTQVLSFATSADVLSTVTSTVDGLGVLQEGRVAGMAGALMSRAARRGLEGLALFGTVPMVAANLPCLKVSQALLEVFVRLTGLEIDLGELVRQARLFEEGIGRLMEQVKKLGGELPGMELQAELGGPPTEEDPSVEVGAFEPELTPDPVDPGVVAQIEALFLRATQDRGVAFELKRHLDEHELFLAYEDRFLDLFSGRGTGRDAA